MMLHGSPSDHRAPMDHLEPAFRGRHGWRRIYPDLPGHGRTPGSALIRDMDDYVDAVIEFIDATCGKRGVTLGGISFGSYIALAVARKRPKRVDGLLLSVPEIHHSPKEDRLDNAWNPRRERTTQAHLPGGKYVEDTAWLTSLPWKDVSYPLYDPKARITVPTLLLFGARDSPFRARTYWKLLPSFSRATFAILGGAGHALWWQKGPLARLLVHDWLYWVEEVSARKRVRRPPSAFVSRRLRSRDLAWLPPSPS